MPFRNEGICHMVTLAGEEEDVHQRYEEVLYSTGWFRRPSPRTLVYLGRGLNKLDVMSILTE